MKQLKNKSIKPFEILGKNELSLLKGGDEREYYYVIIDGERVKIYV